MANEFIVKNGIILKSGTIEIGDATTTGYTFPSTDGTNGQVLTTDGSGNITFQTPSGGGGTVTTEMLRVTYLFSGDLDTIDSTTSGINSAAVASASDIDVTFTGYSYPPFSMITYGYNNTSDVYNIAHVTDIFVTRNIDANGGSAFGSLTTSEVLTINMSTSNTGAQNSQHAWLVFLFGG